MPTPAHQRARQRACLAIVITLLLAAGIGLLMVPMKLPLMMRVLLAAGDIAVALVLFTVLKQRREPE